MIADGLRVYLRLALCAALVAPGGLAVAAAPSAEAGRTFHERDCTACHARLFDGDPARIYERAERRVRSRNALAAQITFCTTQLNLGYFPEDEDAVAAYLEQRYYRFAP